MCGERGGFFANTDADRRIAFGGVDNFCAWRAASAPAIWHEASWA
jgi:hypothetical protein